MYEGTLGIGTIFFAKKKTKTARLPAPGDKTRARPAESGGASKMTHEHETAHRLADVARFINPFCFQ